MINYSVLQYKLLQLQEFSIMSGRITRSSSRTRSRSTSPPASTPGPITVPASATQNVSPASPTTTVAGPPAMLVNQSNSFITTRMYALQTPVELKAPKLEHATAEQYKAFLYKFKSYKDEDNGIQHMVQLISIVARKTISILLEIDVQDFLKLSDDDCQHALNKHFELDNNTNYKFVLKKISMSAASNDAINLEEIQIYVNRFLNLVYDNPSYVNQATGGASPKIMNDLFIDGFSPPFFKSIVRDLGTTTYADTVKQLPRLYKDMESFSKYLKKFNDMSKPSNKSITKPEMKSADAKQPVAVARCTPTKCNGPYHTPDQCFIMHPELRNATKVNSGAKKGLVATVIKGIKGDEDIKDFVNAEKDAEIMMLKAMLAAKSDNEVQKNFSKNKKPIYIDRK